MKLVEVKNNLAKIYYQPTVDSLVLSDFVKLDDGNKAILAQVISLETTSQDDTNCAVLKLSLDINDDGTISAYNGYTPAKNANLKIASNDLLTSIFSKKQNSFHLGNLSTTKEIAINLSKKH